MRKETAKQTIKKNLKTSGDLYNITSCYNWLSRINAGWSGDFSELEYYYEIKYINEYVSVDDMETYYPLLRALLALGKEESKEYILSIADKDDPYIEYLTK